MSANRLFQSASVSLVMTFTLGVAVGFSLCYAFMVVTGGDRNAHVSAPATAPDARTADVGPSAAPQTEEKAAATVAAPTAPGPDVAAPPVPSPTPVPAPTASAQSAVPQPVPAPLSSPTPATPEEMKRLWPARQLFVTLPAGPIDPAWVALLKTYSPGGVLVTTSDSMHGADVAATIRQAKETVGMGVSQSDLPLALIGQEGGANNPLGLSPAPTPRELGGSGAGKTLRETALRYARAARAAGAAALLGPRLDLASAMNDNANLCFGTSSDEVSEAGIAFARAAAEGGVLPIVMHYPGTGTAVRTASGPPIVAETNLEALTDIMLPFANAAAEQLPGILVGCVTVPTLDKTQTGRPACASPVMVQGILRDKWAYQGVVLADAGQPSLAAPVALDVFVTNCLAAGCDAVLLGQVSPAEFEQTCRTLTVALRDGALSTDRMAASRARLASWSLALKMEMPASEKKPAEPPAPPPITDVTPPTPQPATAPEPVPAPTPSPANTPEPATGVVEHTIAPGETLDGIAKKYGVSPAEIVKQNNLKNTNNIQAGAKLKIRPPTPPETPKPSATPEPATTPPPAAPVVIQEAAPAPETPVAPAAPAETPKTEEKPDKAAPEVPSTPVAKPEEAKTEDNATPTPPESNAVTESKPEPVPEPEVKPVETAPIPAPASTEQPPVAVPEKPAPAPETPAVAPETVQTTVPVPEKKPAETAPSKPTAEAKKEPVSEDNGQYEIHVVQKGETLYRLAINSGTTQEELMRLNGLKDPTLVKLGAKLKVPKKGVAKPQAENQEFGSQNPEEERPVVISF